MANGQFVLPGTLENEELRHQIDGSFQESLVTATPKPEQRAEGYSGPPYDDLIDRQVDLESHRAFATPEVWKRALKNEKFKGIINGL